MHLYLIPTICCSHTSHKALCTVATKRVRKHPALTRMVSLVLCIPGAGAAAAAAAAAASDGFVWFVSASVPVAVVAGLGLAEDPVAIGASSMSASSMCSNILHLIIKTREEGRRKRRRVRGRGRGRRGEGKRVPIHSSLHRSVINDT